MKPAYFRSILFNLCFYIIVGAMCVIMLPTLVLPRKFFMGTVHMFVHTVHFLERFVLGLRYEIRGAEHLPKDGSYIVAAKHQSAYETMKLHVLFKDPAIILKKQLLYIPLWGLYLRKSGPIAIDRSTPDAAIESIQTGARRIQQENRPIIIFPQGTRVSTDATTEQKPYKVGVARIQEATELDIIPMAMNAGMFWPRNSFFKSSGTVIFEFFPPVKSGLSRDQLLKKLENTIEPASLSLMNEAREKAQEKSMFKGILGGVIALLTLLFIGYSALWFYVAGEIKRQYPLALADLMDTEQTPQTPVITGFPGQIRASVDQERLKTPFASVEIQTIRAHGWPIPNAPITLTTGPVTARSFRWREPLEFDSVMAVVNTDGQVLNIADSELVQGEFLARLAGTVDLKQEPIPKPDLVITLENHKDFISSLLTSEVIDKRSASFAEGALQFFVNEQGTVQVPLHQHGKTVKLGPLPLFIIPEKLNEPPRRQPNRPPSFANPTRASETGLDTPQVPSP